MDIFFVVSDASRRGLTAAQRIWRLVDDLKITIGHKYLILNRNRGEVPKDVMDIINNEPMNLAGVIPDDPKIYDSDQAGLPTSVLLTENHPATIAAMEIFKKTLVDD
jgi:CO dehydrogenase maturation factor